MKTKEDLKKEIQTEWEKFEAKVLGEEAGDIQRSEMRMGFISGMLIISTMLKRSDQTADEITAISESVLDVSQEYAQGKEVLKVYYKNKDKS